MYRFSILLQTWSVTIALCGYPIVKMEIRDSSQISTTALIFLLYNYFRQKYLEITSCAVSLLNNIWVRVEHNLLQQLNFRKSQLQFKQSAGRMWFELWGRVEHWSQNSIKYFTWWKKSRKIFVYFRSHFHNVAGPGEKSYFGVFFLA